MNIQRQQVETWLPETAQISATWSSMWERVWGTEVDRSGFRS